MLRMHGALHPLLYTFLMWFLGTGTTFISVNYGTDTCIVSLLFSRLQGAVAECETSCVSNIADVPCKRALKQPFGEQGTPPSKVGVYCIYSYLYTWSEKLFSI
jgi:hypothetical protein